MSGCCGQPRSSRKRHTTEPLPENPKLEDGVALVYIGSGKRQIRGSVSGTHYFVAERRRHFRVDRRDVDALIRKPEFMLKV